MSFKRCDENAYPSTDIRDFVDAVLDTNTGSTRLIERVASFRTTSRTTVVTLEQQNLVRQFLAEFEALKRRRRNLDAHYGWVLASDSELVYRSMGGKSKSGTAWARRWIRGIFEEYERLGQALANAEQELADSMQSAQSSCDSNLIHH